MNNFPFDAGDGFGTFWVLRSNYRLDNDIPKYWKRYVGWVSLDEASRYTDEEKYNLSNMNYCWEKTNQ